MKTDEEIRNEVLREIRSIPQLRNSTIEVSVKNGVVTLDGKVDSLFEKRLARNAAERVLGIQAIVNELQVALSEENQFSDAEIRRAIEESLKWNASIPPSQIQVSVESGWITLAGNVDWPSQREAVEAIAEGTRGVKGITNLILVERELASWVE
ncbi:MAG: transport-associated protein [Bacteriovoracaceae bacterium]|nr:transport-associated protein [Bacteriovoracaceae bacterium]